MTEKIATIINYCSNDYPFLKDCLTQAKKFSEKIIVAVADHLFDGKKEDLEEMKRTFSEFAFATFIIYPFIPEKIPKRIQKKVRKNSMWHSVSRMVGSFFLEKEIEYVLFLDVDEIIDGDRFKKWLDEKSYLKYEALRLANYWYFRSVSSQATKWEDTAILVKRKKIKRKSLLDSTERDAIFNAITGNKKRNALDLDNEPMIHHYSWVKTKQQMLTKVQTWGHKDDKNWTQLIENEFQKEDSPKDFVHGYDLIKVSPFVNIDISCHSPSLIENPSAKKPCVDNTNAYQNNITPSLEEIKNNHYNNIKCLSEKSLLNIIMKRSLKDFIYCYFEEFQLLLQRKIPNIFV